MTWLRVVLACLRDRLERQDTGDQAYFWTPEWQAGEAEAQADIDAGRVECYDSVQDFLDSLSS